MDQNKVPLQSVVIVYVDEAGDYHRQPLSDISEVGTLIDPDTGDDMEMLWAEVNPDGDENPEHKIHL